MKIEWTLASKNDYWGNIEYLENNWSEKEVINFINEVEYSLKLLSKGNVTFNKTEIPYVYKMTLLKQINLYYSIQNKTIYVLRFWNNYQDLSNFKLK